MVHKCLTSLPLWLKNSMNFDPTFLTDSFETLESFTHPHGFCAYCGWTSPNCDNSVFWAIFPLWARFVSEDYLSLHFFEHLLSPVTLASEQCEGGLIIYSSMKNCLPVVGVFSNFMYFSS